MKRVLITGMSGTGKSSVTRQLAGRGYEAYDLDTPEWSQWIDAAPSDMLTPTPGKDWVWREDRVRALLSEQRNETLFVSGCAENMGRLFPLIDTIVLLSAPVATIMERLTTRSAGSYGHLEEEQRKVACLISAIEPLLRQSADYEIDTRRPISDTVDEILRFCPIEEHAMTDTIGVPNIFPALKYDDAPAAIEWLHKAFGFERKFVVPGENNTVMHAELRNGAGMIMMGSGSKPDPKNPWTTERYGTYVVVKDIDAHFARAKAAGAKIERPLTDTDYGAREYSARDCEGHLWSFGTYDPYAGS